MKPVRGLRAARLLFGLFFSTALVRPAESAEKSGTQADPFPPAAVVKAAKSPLELTLDIYKTRLHPGESIWYQLRLKNIGRKRIRVKDEVFSAPQIMDQRSLEDGPGLYLEVRDAHGKQPWPRKRGHVPAVGVDAAPFPRGVPASIVDYERAKRAPEIAEWKRAGLSDQAIDEKLVALWRDETGGRSDAVPAPEFWLDANASTATTAYAHGDGADAPRSSPVGNYAELAGWYLPPGIYRVRAVMNRYSSGKAIVKHLATPFIEIEVIR